ncbi:MAG: extracellular solute-binding protein, partial [Phycisphaerae bacterium]|nr:extracellular solute-binding protein [Phycisphaerae bacterium]
MKYIFVTIMAVLVVWSAVAWRITPETRARQYVTPATPTPAHGWRNLPPSTPPPLSIKLDALCNMQPANPDGLHLLVFGAAEPKEANAPAYNRVALCIGPDYANKLAETPVSPWQWTDPFNIELKAESGTRALDWRMNLRHLAPDATKLLLYLSHVYDEEGVRPLQQALYAGLDRPVDWRTQLTWVTDLNPQRRPQIEAFNRWYPECFLGLIPADASGVNVQRNIVQACSGVGPAIIDVYGIHELQMYASAGILMDLTDVAKKMGFGPDVTYPKARPGMFIDGKQYCFPCNVNARILIYNKNLFDRYDVPYPPTDHVIDWLEFVEKYAKPLTVRPPGRAVPDCFGIALEKEEWQDTLYQAGGTVFADDGTRCVVDSPRAIAGIRMYRDLMHKYNVTPDPVQKVGMSSQGGWGAGWMNWFGAQKMASIRIGKWALIVLRRYIEEQRRRFAKRFPQTSIPTDPNHIRPWTKQWMIDHPAPADWPPLRLGAMHVPRMPGCPPLVLLTQRSAAVSAMHPHADKAVQFLQFLAGPEYSRLINSGADALPGNRKYADIDQQLSPDWPDERDLHVLTNQAVAWGKVREVSPFVDAMEMFRLIRAQVQRLEADPDFTAEQAMQIAAKDVNDAIQRNLRNDPKFKKRYDQTIAKQRPPIATAPPCHGWVPHRFSGGEHEFERETASPRSTGILPVTHTRVPHRFSGGEHEFERETASPRTGILPVTHTRVPHRFSGGEHE